MSALKGAFEVSAENPVTSILDSQRFADWFISQVGRSQLIQTLERHNRLVQRATKSFNTTIPGHCLKVRNIPHTASYRTTHMLHYSTANNA